MAAQRDQVHGLCREGEWRGEVPYGQARQGDDAYWGGPAGAQENQEQWKPSEGEKHPPAGRFRTAR